ncbi:MAG: helix-turn-helix domain-containing protein [Akkermansia sp.]
MHINTDFSQTFTRLLKQSCLSQLELAERTGIHKQTINRYATAKTVPGWVELLKLADALGCSLDSFRTGELSSYSSIDENKLEQMKPIIKELGSVVNKLTSFISE